MAHEKAKGQQAEKLFLGSLRASRAIKKSTILLIFGTLLVGGCGGHGFYF